MSNNNPNKKYRNIKDIYLPYSNETIKKGTIFSANPEDIISAYRDKDNHFASIQALSNKEWFEEVVEDRIEVGSIYRDKDWINAPTYRYFFHTNKKYNSISEEKLEIIRQSIEEIINTDTNIECNTGLMSQSDMYKLGYKDGVKYGNLGKNTQQGNNPQNNAT